VAREVELFQDAVKGSAKVQVKKWSL